MINCERCGEESNERVLYIQNARGGSKSMWDAVRLCRELGMTNEEIIELFKETFERLREWED